MSKSHSRRAILAGIAAASALAAPALALSGPDPIFAAIEAHKRAYAAVDQIIDQQAALETALPRAKRRWSWTCFDLQPLADCADDPRWLAMQEQAELLGRARDVAQMGLLTTRATTTAGLAALLRYAYEFRDRGDEWPDLIRDDDGDLSTRHLLSAAGKLEEDEDGAHDFEVELCRVVADALDAIGGVS